MLLMETLAEERILAAMQRGEFDNLAGAGRPLPADDLAMLPEELRMACRILKNAGYAPPQLLLRRQIDDLAVTLAKENAGETRERGRKRLFCLLQQLTDGEQRALHLSLQEHYYRQLQQRLAGT